jgi:hypothetical protein
MNILDIIIIALTVTLSAIVWLKTVSKLAKRRIEMKNSPDVDTL